MVNTTHLLVNRQHCARRRRAKILRGALSRRAAQHFSSHSVRELATTSRDNSYYLLRSETIEVVKVALSPDPIKSLKAPEAPET